MITLWRSTVGKKVVMAATGLVWVGFVVVHMAGNLKIYQGEAKFDAYSAYLREVGAPFFGHAQLLWLARVILLAAIVFHVSAAWQLRRLSRAARPVAYAEREALTATLASRTMGWGGVVILLFVVYHLLHFTAGVVGYQPGQYQPLSVYRNVVLGFSVWYVSAFYVAAMVALGLHLYHGVWSTLQTLGLETASVRPGYRVLAAVVAGTVVAGNVSIPVAVLTGLVR